MSGINYLVNNSVVLSGITKYAAALTSGQIFVCPEEAIQQFATATFSVQLSTVVPVTFLAEVTNATTWNTLIEFNPTELIFTINVPINYKKLRVTITCGLTPIASVNFCTFYSTNAPGATLKEAGQDITANDLFALGTNNLTGTNKNINSSNILATLSADHALRTVDSTKIYALDQQQWLTQQVQIQNILGIDQTFEDTGLIIYAGSVNMTANSMIRSAGNINYGSSSILVLRMSGTFTNGSNSSSLATISIGPNAIGFGAYDTGSFGLFYSSTGQYPVITVLVTTAFVSGGTIQVTIGTNTYPVPGMVASTSTSDSAAQIVTAFNAIVTNNLYRAAQYGSTVIFTGISQINVSGASINPAATGLVTISTVTVTGTTSVNTFIDSTNFNIAPFQWTSGNYMELQLTVMNNGRYIKLSGVNEITQELVDLTTAVLPYRFGSSVMPINAVCLGTSTEMSIDNAILYSVTDNIPRAPTVIGMNVLRMNNISVQTGSLGIPVGFISRTNTGPVAIIKKVSIMNHSANVIYAMVSRGSVKGPVVFDTTSVGTYASAVYTVSAVPIGSLTIDYGNILFSMVAQESFEQELGYPLETGSSLMVSVCSGTYIEGTADIVFFIEYHT